MKKILITILFISIYLISVSHSEARCTIKCFAKYAKVGNGSASWSNEYQVEVNFMTGKELYESTLDTKYLGNYYAVIFWGPNQATVIKLESGATTASMEVSCGEKIDCKCFNPLLVFTSGNDQENRYWIISSKSS